MLVSGDLLIGQPSHAWVSGQLARAWGNARFPRSSGWEAVCLAAEQHDVGWADEDRRPRLDPATGTALPFTRIPRAEHLAIWSSAAPRLLAQSRYAALLASLHGTSLYGPAFVAQLPEGDRPAVAAYLEGERALQRELAAGLDARRVDVDRRLVRTWDRISLALCMPEWPQAVPGVPAAGGAEATLTVAHTGPGRATLDPWPFAASAVTVACEARRVAPIHEDPEAFRSAFERAPWVALRWELVPARPATS